MLDFRVETFLTVCETMNFTRAAELLHITQPAVSQHIHALEAQYGTRLFLYEGKQLRLTESGQMLYMAQRVGITSIVCTPHVRDPYFDYERMWGAFRTLQAYAQGFPLQMGWEVNHTKLMELGLEWADRLHFDGSDEFLLELSSRCTKDDFPEYERTIYELQGLGYRVIVAHPERYRAVQKDPSLAERLVDLGCELQASADFVAGGRLGREKRPAKKLLQRGLYSYVASDAHRPSHYGYLARALRDYDWEGGTGW